LVLVLLTTALAGGPVGDSGAVRIAGTVRLTQGFLSRQQVSAGFSPEESTVVFNGAQAGDKCDALYIVNYDGSGLKRLFSGDSPVLTPAFSSDGRRICFNSGPSIYEYSLATDKCRRILDDARDSEARPVYARGRMILYRSSHGIRLSESQPPANAKPASRLVTFGPDDAQPALSRDGRELAYVRPDQGTRLFVMPIDSPPGRPLELAKGAVANPGWSPDGTLLAYEKLVGQQRSIFLFSRRTGRESRLIADTLASCHAPAFAPDGSALVYTRVTAYGQDVMLATLAGVAAAAPESAPGLVSDTGAKAFDRSGIKVVVFAGDQDQGRALLTKLGRRGYANPENYVAGDPTRRAEAKYHDVPGPAIAEIVSTTRSYLNLELEPVADDRLPPGCVYVNLP
jgi:hypothetical protein